MATQRLPTVNIDPEFSNLIIPHQPDELRRLRADIKANNCLAPLIA